MDSCNQKTANSKWQDMEELQPLPPLVAAVAA
jgi:hypothetical protein